MTETTEQIRTRYDEALNSVVECARADSTVLAVILVGSLAYDVVWERSDIDLCLVVQEGKHKKTSICLTERDVTIHASIVTRSALKRLLEGALQGSFMNSLMSKGRIVFSRDETIDDLYESRGRLGERDRGIKMLQSAVEVIWSLSKAHKWLQARKDPYYSFFWIMKCLDSLASIEATWHGEIATREVVQQALRLNPVVFEPLYTELISGPKTLETIGAALQQIDSYLMERTPVLFETIFSYLADAGAPRSATEIDDHFSANWSSGSASAACEWLADMGQIQRLSVPARITDRSRVDFQEAAYYFDADGVR